MDYRQILSQYDETYAKAEVFGAELPDGEYTVQVMDMGFKTSRNTGDTYLLWTLKVLTAGFDGRKAFKRNMITPKSIVFLKNDLEAAGLKIVKLSDELPAHMADLLDRVLVIRVKTSTGGYKNMDILGPVKTEAPAAPPTPPESDKSAPPPKKDDIPF